MKTTNKGSTSIGNGAVRLAAIACATWLTGWVGCGGDGSEYSTQTASPGSGRASARTLAVSPSAWVTVPAPADPLLLNLDIPADAPTRGMWSSVHHWPLNALHATVLPNGKLLTYGTTPDGAYQSGRYLDLWDPAQGFAQSAHNTTYDRNRQDSFCSTATFLVDGRLLITGGNGSITSSFYTPSSNSTVTVPAELADERWYATMLTLSDGRPLIMGGMRPYGESMQDNPDQAVAQGVASMTPEVHENGTWRSLFGAYSREAFGPDFLRASYPRAWVMPSGQVFGVSAERMWSLDPSGNGAITIHGAFKTAPGNMADPPNVGSTNTAVMFDVGKVLIAGGNGGFNGDGWPASKQATVIDMNTDSPVLTEQPPMNFPRRYPNAVVLPDGEVLITGGSKRGNENGSQAVYAAEIWNPANGTWTMGPDAATYRGYHGFSVLLPNGTVLTTGGGSPGPVTNLNAEVYYPAQLFRSISGVAQLAPRPVMRGISSLSHAHGAQMQLDMSSAAPISKLVLIGLSSGTHSFNTGQRRIPLTFMQDTIRLTTTIPGATLVPPGYYQVVAIDAEGVPSRGTLIAIGQGVAAPPTETKPYTPADIGAPTTNPPPRRH